MLEQQERGGVELTVELRGAWFNTDVVVGDIVRVISPRFLPGPPADTPLDARDGLSGSVCVVQDDAGLLVLQPDTLVSPTRIASSFDCMRKAVLSDRFRSRDGTSRAMLWGTILHDVFELAITSSHPKPFGAAQLTASIHATSARYLSDLWSLQLTQASACEELAAYIPALQSWAARFVRKGAPVSRVGFHRPNKERAAVPLAIHRVRTPRPSRLPPCMLQLHRLQRLLA